MKKNIYFLLIGVLIISCNVSRKVNSDLSHITLSVLWPQSLMAIFLTDGVAAIYRIEGLNEHTDVVIQRLEAKIANNKWSGIMEINDVKAFIVNDSVVFDSVQIPAYRGLITDSNAVAVTVYYSYILEDKSVSRVKCLQSEFILKNSELIHLSEFSPCSPKKSSWYLPKKKTENQILGN